MSRIEAAAILSVSITAGIITFVKIAFPKNIKNENDDIEVEIDLDDSEVEPE